MAQDTASFMVRRLGDTISAIDIQGDVTAASETPLMSAFQTATDDGARIVLLDFDGLEYMNSGGIGLLVTLLVRANRQKQRLLACGLSDHYRQILELTRLDEAIAIYADEAEALAAMSS
jgi:anti-sigma B factor antagonist